CLPADRLSVRITRMNEQNKVTDQPASVPGQAAVKVPNFLERFLTSHPAGFWFFFWGELAERSCYYGMRAILFLYVARELNFGDDDASTIVSLFIAACYLLPLIGGYLADNFFGKYGTIVGFSLPYIFGQLLLSIDSQSVLGIS